VKYSGTLIAVSDMDKSKKFYNNVLGLKVIADFGANVMLEEGLFLQTLLILGTGLSETNK
jgi:lactoylglutathione lyase